MTLMQPINTDFDKTLSQKRLNYIRFCKKPDLKKDSNPIESVQSVLSVFY